MLQAGRTRITGRIQSTSRPSLQHLTVCVSMTITVTPHYQNLHLINFHVNSFGMRNVLLTKSELRPSSSARQLSPVDVQGLHFLSFLHLCVF